MCVFWFLCVIVLFLKPHNSHIVLYVIFYLLLLFAVGNKMVSEESQIRHSIQTGLCWWVLPYITIEFGKLLNSLYFSLTLTVSVVYPPCFVCNFILKTVFSEDYEEYGTTEVSRYLHGCLLGGSLSVLEDFLVNMGDCTVITFSEVLYISLFIECSCRENCPVAGL